MRQKRGHSRRSKGDKRLKEEPLIWLEKNKRQSETFKYLDYKMQVKPCNNNCNDLLYDTDNFTAVIEESERRQLELGEQVREATHRAEQAEREGEERLEEVEGRLVEMERGFREGERRRRQAEERVRTAVERQRGAEERMMEAEDSRRQAEDMAQQLHQEALRRTQQADYRLRRETQQRMQCKQQIEQLEAER